MIHSVYKSLKAFYEVFIKGTDISMAVIFAEPMPYVRLIKGDKQYIIPFDDVLAEKDVIYMQDLFMSSIEHFRKETEE